VSALASGWAAHGRRIILGMVLHTHGIWSRCLPRSVFDCWCWFQVVRQFRKLAADRFARRSEQSFRGSFRMFCGWVQRLQPLPFWFSCSTARKNARSSSVAQLERDFAARGEKLLTRVTLLRRSRTQKILLRAKSSKPLFDYHFRSASARRFGAIRGSKISHDFEPDRRGTISLAADTNTPGANWRCKRRSISRHGTDSIALIRFLPPLCNRSPGRRSSSIAGSIQPRTQRTGTTQSSATLPFSASL